jgi:tetratricopeptide (TPR) repeat protein
MDLVRALSSRDSAELCAVVGNWQQASYAYAGANYGLLDWSHRLRYQEGYYLRAESIDDSERLVVEPATLEDAGQYEAAVQAWRQTWRRLVSGRIRSYHNEDVLIVKVRHQLFEELQYRLVQALRAARRGAVDEAQDLCESTLKIYDTLAHEYPRLSDYPLYAAWCRYNYSAILGAGGNQSGANREFAAAKTAIERVQIDENDAVALADSAWFLSNCPDERLRDTDRAVEAARRATRLSPAVGQTWEILGCAAFWAGKYEEAIEAYERACALNDGPRPVGFLIAAAQRRIGNQDAARTLLEDMDAWASTIRPEQEWQNYVEYLRPIATESPTRDDNSRQRPLGVLPPPSCESALGVSP